MTSQSRPTIADVARIAEVSTATVSRVLNGNDKVDPDLAERVRRAIADMHYVPNLAGRALRRAQSDMWAMIVPDARNPFFTAVLQEFETVAAAKGHSVVMCNSHENFERERHYIDAVIAQQVSGVVLAATSATRTSVRRLTAAGIPVVLFDRRIKSFSGDIVTVDNVMAGRLAAEHMLGRSVRTPFILTGPKTVSSTVDRDAGFRSVFEAHDLPVGPDHVLRLDLTAETAEQELAAALGGASHIDGLFATNGPMTSAAFTCLQAIGWSMPQRISFVGVDDEHWTRMVTPKVTLIGQPIDQLGQWAAKLLENRSTQPDDKPVRIVLEPNLIVRESSLH
ncbi:Transcriptional regulator, LacI family [Acidipropionibacterium acidipropionici ATCC 4875]|uniref:Transcriptional regulator, LacI family n=1 Tax=Acidipropionibacterium acidipropionici (strain ATCC 4875 / DSM 20272 / JCM 6432 / NBRC 12425 / NCIMB 8070 / 4) TaxID=1171373 RepID=K7RRY3_ACIA4|nr:LacI family DNA-binding transcriptional regulator [Acidipropionibacterium acidipropionici]AFV90789.1 Transcriptional regulator, LacI family [Acidipropionibacterium acidipropionici ATCC 4875]ALN15062.1 hypothetical protein ASQ49_07030 [Acidipropionibacterium acidipropionici]APZ09188.1 LacI family transcriptional regulator [Acidipropionibacterium acidipropionici]MDN6555188.1 LacI family transcriptional regulator [Acidipropionibacterium acidipropionici]